MHLLFLNYSTSSNIYCSKNFIQFFHWMCTLGLSQGTETSLHSDRLEMAASTNRKNSCPVATYFLRLAKLIE